MGDNFAVQANVISEPILRAVRRGGDEIELCSSPLVEREQVNVEALRSTIVAVTDDRTVRPGIQAIRVDVTLDSDATREEKEELIRVVTQRSPIRNTLVAGTAIETVLV